MNIFSSKFFPMEPKSYPKPFNDPRYVFEVKWDGVRILSFLQNGKLCLKNRKGHDRTVQYPEIQSLVALIGGKEAVFDGEMVVLSENGKPSFPAVLRRDLLRRREKISFSIKRWPVIYVVFDLLWWEGQSLLNLPWEERYTRLKEIMAPCANLHLIENFEDGLCLFDAVQEQGMEGIVAKQKTSPYLAGKKSNYWLKMKCRQQRNFVIGGYLMRSGEIASLLIGAYAEQKLIYLGKVNAAIQGKEELARSLAGNKTHFSPFFPQPSFSQREKVFWVLPELVVTVEFFEWTEGLKLRAPKIIGFPGVSPHECKI